MLQVDTTNRDDLKKYFKKNSIPTEAQFAELIDGMLNQRDDGIARVAGAPVSLKAEGDAAGTQPILSLYRDFADNSEEWTLSLNPRSNPADATSARRGLGIRDGDGNNRLFIDRTSGSLGIGTNAPQSSLHLNTPGGATPVNAVTIDVVTFGTRDNASASYFLRVRDIGAAPPDGITFFAIRGNGAVGIGTPQPNARLTVTAPGASNIEGSAMSGVFITSAGVLGGNPGDELALTSIGFHSGNNSSLGIRAFRTTNGGGWDTTAIGLGMDVDNTIRAGASIWLHGNGNVGMGTTAPQSRLHVASNAGVLNLEGQDHAYIQWYPFGFGAGRQAWIGYGSAGDTALTITNEAGRMHIGGTELLYLLNQSGVIVGKEWGGSGDLTVEGAISAGNSDIYFTKTDHNHTGIGNQDGFAAIENAADFGALMLLGRSTGFGRLIRAWDSLEVIGQFLDHSDRRSKKDIEDLHYGLDEIRRLRPVSFNRKEIYNPHKSVGLVAQEVQEVIHEVVFSSPAPTNVPNLSINYHGLIPVLINAIKELDAQVQRLNAEQGAR